MASAELSRNGCVLSQATTHSVDTLLKSTRVQMDVRKLHPLPHGFKVSLCQLISPMQQ